MQRNAIIGTIAVLAILAAVTSIFFTGKGSGYNASLKPSGALGEVLAEETAALLNQRGRIVVVEWDLKPDQLPRSSELVKSFKETLKKKKGISIVHSQLIPVEGPILSVLGAGLRASEFLKLSQSYADADAIVSFVGAPLLSRQQLEPLKTPRPKVIVVDVASIEKVARPPGADIQELIKAGVVDIAVVSTTGDTADARGDSKSRGGNFDPHFKVLLAQNK